MEKALYEQILEEAAAKVAEYHLYHNSLEIRHQRNRDRIADAPPKQIFVPEHWSVDKKHNPFYVVKRAKQIAKAVSKKILNGTYEPQQPFQRLIPKKGGGFRPVNIYQLQDAAVSDLFYDNLLAKNRHRFSSLSYAYRNDRNVHFAIQDVALEFKLAPRFYIAEFDFSNFFGAIDHTYLFRQVRENSFLISVKEEEIIKAFLRPFNGKGIPQGTSISLFLANMICWRLDRKFEEVGLRFARYADDTIVWSNDYGKIGEAFNIISDFSKDSGIDINFDKSDGISLMQREKMPGEFKKIKTFIEFLGYKISIDKVSIKHKSVLKIKKQISYLLYRNLIQPIQGLPFRGMNFPANDRDRDFLRAIRQIRRYLYGNLTERTLQNVLSGGYRRLIFKGLMSFYPLLDDEEQLRDLDKWMVSTILKVLHRRLSLFHAHGHTQISGSRFPFNCTSLDLIPRCLETPASGNRGTYQIPSFLRIYRVIKLGLQNEGIEWVMSQESPSYNYD
jgi:RNA-directed DNA polymerase